MQCLDEQEACSAPLGLLLNIDPLLACTVALNINNRPIEILHRIPTVVPDFLKLYKNQVVQ
jgi:hypothetical protein